MGARGGHGWKGDTAVLGQSSSMPLVLKTAEGGARICREGRIFYPLPKIRLIMHAADHGPACLLPGGMSVSKARAKCVKETKSSPSIEELLVLASAFDHEISPVLLKSQPVLSSF